MAVAVVALDAPFGVELRGLDLRQEQPEHIRATARAAFAEHHLVLVRDQHLDAAAQERFAAWFGAIDRRSSRGRSTTTFISNTRPEGVAREGSLLKHQDYCFHAELLLGLCLAAEEVPSVGGETIFASAHLAHDALDAPDRDALVGLDARHVYDAASDDGTRRFRVAAAPDAPTAQHPVLLRHPVSGRPLLYVNELMTDCIVGLDPHESEAVLARLFGRFDDPAVVYRHRWQVGDVVVWDNIALQHGRAPFDPGERRSLRRVQIDQAAGPDRG
jgi:taurine dioxygenase